MPETYARIIAERGDIEVVSPPAQMPSIDVHLYGHKAYEREPALVWFRDLLRILLRNKQAPTRARKPKKPAAVMPRETTTMPKPHQIAAASDTGTSWPRSVR